MKTSEKLYYRYESLAKKYASKIYSYEELSYEYEDLVQEFKIKIFTSIKAYGRRWAKYRNEGYSKPVPLKYYLEAACSNKMRDFMKYISRENHKLRIDEINYDFGVESQCTIEPENNKFVINDIDLLEGLTGKERVIFSLFLRGYNSKFLNRVYFNNEDEKRIRKEVIKSDDEPIGINDIIEAQRNKLIAKYGGELMKTSEKYESYSYDDE